MHEDWYEMSTGERISAAHLDNLAFSLMSRMHVILRRQIGRVTDIDYMRNDPAHCRHLLELGAGSSNEDLQKICAKLQEIYFSPEGLFVRMPLKPPLLERLTVPKEAVRETQPSPSTNTAAADLPSVNRVPAAAEPATNFNDVGITVDQTYIGRLR